jgi:hypothetical protein
MGHARCNRTAMACMVYVELHAGHIERGHGLYARGDSMPQLTRERLYSFNDNHRASIYKNRRINEIIRHARKSATLYARQLTADGVVDGVTYRGRYAWTAAEAMAAGGYEQGIRNTLERSYQVHPALLDYSLRLVKEFVSSKI